MNGISLKLFHLDAENYTRKFRFSLSVSDTVVITGVQLMMVMPASSKALLPEPFHSLMDDPQSPIADYYPADFEVDGEGKRSDWEVVILLPFIDFERLKTCLLYTSPSPRD